VLDFPDMVHGFFSRGDPNDAKVHAACSRAMEATLALFNANRAQA
jgi:hypothetical protein